jgi:uncharacterized protein
MAENIEPTPEFSAEPGEITSDDRLWGALSYFTIIAIIMLLMDDKRARPFIKFHAVQAIAFAVVLAILSIIIGWIPFVGCIVPFFWLILLWPAIGAYQGKYVEVPVVTNFIRGQGWV